jgi:hypothetical protein
MPVLDYTDYTDDYETIFISKVCVEFNDGRKEEAIYRHREDLTLVDAMTLALIRCESMERVTVGDAELIIATAARRVSFEGIGSYGCTCRRRDCSKGELFPYPWLDADEDVTDQGESDGDLTH